jgi:signal peptide peptidase SppA
MRADVSRLLTAFYGMPWAILPDRLATIRTVLLRWEAGIRLSPDEIRAAVGGAPQAAEQREQQAQRSPPRGVAVIPVYGVLAPRVHQVQNISGEGAMTYERLAQNFRKALQDPAVGAIVFDIDSPGGSFYGLQEFADEIHGARSQKKIVAVVNTLAASAAFWIGSAAEELVVTPSGDVGSVGVWGAHEDHSKALDQAGIKVTLISAGKYKVEGNPFGPLSEEALAYLQQEVDAAHEVFVRALARNRGTTAENVRKNFGEGRVVGAKAAVERGMADRIATLDETLARLMKSPAAQRPKTRDASMALRLAELG